LPYLFVYFRGRIQHLADAVRPGLRQRPCAVFCQQAVVVVLVQQAYFYLRIERFKLTQLAVFMGYQVLFHGGQFDVEIERRDVKVRGEHFA
jgi:hypothetical protein